MHVIRPFRYATEHSHEFVHQTRCEHVHVYFKQTLLLDALAFASTADDSSECRNILSSTRPVETRMHEKIKTQV
jgi:hypothetical protein